MKLKIALRWLLFATFVVASLVFESQFAMCAEFADLASLTVVQKQYWVHWANIYSGITVASAAVAVSILVWNIRWHLRHRRSRSFS